MYFVYTSESLPNPEMMGKSGYTPEWFLYGGIQLPILMKGVWTDLPPSYQTMKKFSWKDNPIREMIDTADIVKALVGRWGMRGVIALDHKPSEKEMAQLQKESLERNFKWRQQVVDFYEKQARQLEVKGIGRAEPTIYEEECYEILGVPKPYSVETFRAQRLPGEDASHRLIKVFQEMLETFQGKLQIVPDAPIPGIAEARKR